MTSHIIVFCFGICFAFGNLWDILWTLLNCHNFFLSLVSYVVELMGIQIDYMGSR